MSPPKFLLRDLAFGSLAVVTLAGLFASGFFSPGRQPAAAQADSFAVNSGETTSQAPPSSDRSVPDVAGFVAETSAPVSNPEKSSGGRGIQLGIGGSLNGFRPFPEDNAWNRVITNAPVDPNSRTLIASIGLDKTLHPDFAAGMWDGSRIGIPYVVVGGDQPMVPLEIVAYPGESDPGPYPIPANAPIEGEPNARGDRHVIVLDRDNLKLYELFHSVRGFLGTAWQADSAAIFDLTEHPHRPDGWTSADAAGLPIFPGLVRYDEVVEQKEIRHALRFTVVRSRRAYTPPATHCASRNDSPNLPPMGMRVRLKGTFDVDGYPPQARVILTALKRYGMILADNGGDWFLSGAPDHRWDDEQLRTLKQIRGSDFEVIRMDEITVP